MRWAGPGKGGAGTGGRDLAEVRLVGTAQGARRFGAERQGVFSREFEGNAVFFFSAARTSALLAAAAQAR